METNNILPEVAPKLISSTTSPRNGDKSNYADLLTYIQCTEQIRKKTWFEFFDKISAKPVRNDDESITIEELLQQPSLSLDEAPPKRTMKKNIVTVHTKKIPSMDSENYETCLLQVIEEDLQSNLRELVTSRDFARIFMDDDMYQEVHEKAKDEIYRVTLQIGLPNLRAYMKIVNRVEKKDEVWTLIENVFGSELKSLVAKRQEAKSLKQRMHYAAKIRAECKELASLMAEDDILIYVVYHMKFGQ